MKHQKTSMEFYRIEPDGSESCFLVSLRGGLNAQQAEKVRASMNGLFQYLPTHRVTNQPMLMGDVGLIGPRLEIETPFSTSAVEIARATGHPRVERLEAFRRIPIPKGVDFDEFLTGQRDRVTEQVYQSLPTSFRLDYSIPPVEIIPLLEEGIGALYKFIREQRLGFDEDQIQRIFRYFTRKLQKNPTDVALYQLYAMWSDHCWHRLFFLTHFVIDGVKKPHTLIEMLRTPYEMLKGTSADNVMIGGSDNASATQGFTVSLFLPANPGEPGPYVWQQVCLHCLFSAETHNYPGHVEPYQGAATEIGGETRDELGAGRSSDILYACCGRVLGSLRFPNGYRIPGEFLPRRLYPYPTDKATPIEVAIKGLQGWQDYANCFGKPCTGGFFYSGAIWRPKRASDGKIVMERVESLKPVCYGFGGGSIRHELLKKGKPQKGMLIVQIGGPAFPIGFLGGPGSSSTSGSNAVDFDINAVQRGGPEMERRFYQVILACIAMGAKLKKKVVSNHDQGASGIANVLTELMGESGGKLYIGSVRRGDSTMSDLKIYLCEYQERQGLLIWKAGLPWLRAVCQRENCPLEVLGEITDDGRLQVFSEKDAAEVKTKAAKPIVDLDLDFLFERVADQVIEDTTAEDIRFPLKIPSDMTLEKAVKSTSRRSEVGSKEWITRGVDGSIGGQVILNQYAGPWATPVNDFSLVAFGSRHQKR